VVVASLPIEKVEPTPYQRDVSETHVKKLMNAMERVGRFLDPIIAVRHEGMYWTPNGSHRLTASKQLGAKSIVALVLPDTDVAYQILALNTEKAHNLKERSLEVIRMYRGLVGAKGGKETDYVALFEEPSFITLGAAYEKRPRYSAGAYHPVVKRLEEFVDKSLDDGLKMREARADKLLAWDDQVVAIVDQLKSRGLVSPYLKNFVVARLNFLRFKKGGTFDFDETIAPHMGGAKKFDTTKVNKEDITRMGGAPAEAADEA
jgi:ParB family chromosome partitioning protein